MCYNLPVTKNIVLVGFMGAGKSVVAKRLAHLLKKEIVETDRLIEANEKRTIAEIFRGSGEKYFRTVEKAIVKALSQRNNLIVDCGGGVVLDDENMVNLKRSGILFYLKATPDVIFQRIKNHRNRPLLNVGDPKARITELLKIRAPRYEQADFTIETSNKTVEEITQEILCLLKP